jgi:transposase-like protein
MTDISNPIFHDEAKAREFLEAQRWPDGPFCPFCGQHETVKALPAAGSMGEGWYHCRECRKKFTVRVGTLYERSHVPLHKWLFATHLLCASKKGMSAHQLHRMLGVTYKTAWFMAHRIREAMRPASDAGPLGGENKVVEADETYIGGKAKNRAFRKEPPKKEAVVSLVERDGKVRSTHVANVTAKTLRNVLVTQASRTSYLMTDEAPTYKRTGREFAGHGSVNHSIDEYVRGGFWHTNTVENFFSILKRGIIGTYHHVSEAHLKRYLGEFDFRYNERAGLGVDDAMRAEKALKGITGKRLTYRRSDTAGHA